MVGVAVGCGEQKGKALLPGDMKVVDAVSTPVVKKETEAQTRSLTMSRRTGKWETDKGVLFVLAVVSELCL